MHDLHADQHDYIGIRVARQLQLPRPQLPQHCTGNLTHFQLLSFTRLLEDQQSLTSV
jgi:hypothetical protein